MGTGSNSIVVSALENLHSSRGSQQGGEPIPAWHLPRGEGSEQDLAQGKSQVGSQHSPCPGNTLELGWAQQPGDSEGKVVAQVEFLILN